MKPEAQLPEVNLKELAQLCEAAPDGNIIEVGVYKGGSAWALNEVARGRKLHLFDTFTGIPEKSDIDGFTIGHFSGVDVEQVKLALPDAIFHIGVFPGTLPDDLKDIAFVHIDCDQYETCRAAIGLLYPRMVKGAYMAFDDYGFAGITKAIHDYFGEPALKFTPCRIPYVGK